MNKDANVVFQVELTDDATIGVTSYLVLVQEAVEVSLKKYKALQGQVLNPVVLPQGDSQPAEFPLFMLTSELVSVQVTKRVLTFNLNYMARAIATKTMADFMATLIKELKKRLDDKVRKAYARFDVSFYRFLEMKNDESKTKRVNDFAKKVLKLEDETEPLDAMQGFQSAYITKHSEDVSKRVFYSFAINNELKTHAIHLGIGAITGNVGGYDFLTFDKQMLEDTNVTALVEYIENDIAEVIDERVESISKSI